MLSNAVIETADTLLKATLAKTAVPPPAAAAKAGAAPAPPEVRT